MKKIIALVGVLLFPILVAGQLSFDTGTYVRFKTLNHGISGPKNGGQASSGLYMLSGRAVLDLGILSELSRNESLEIRCRLDGTLSPQNSANEPMGRDFSIPYYIVDSDSIVDDATEFWFYVPPSYTLAIESAPRVPSKFSV